MIRVLCVGALPLHKAAYDVTSIGPLALLIGGNCRAFGPTEGSHHVSTAGRKAPCVIVNALRKGSVATVLQSKTKAMCEAHSPM